VTSNQDFKVTVLFNVE